MTATTPVDFPAIISGLSRVFADPDFDPRDLILIDLRQVAYEPSMIEIFSIGEILHGFRNKCLGGVTLVVNERILHLARLIGIIAGPPVKIEVLTSLPRTQAVQPVFQSRPVAVSKL